MRRYLFLLLLIQHYDTTYSSAEELYPPLWHLAPSSLSEFPSISNGTDSYRLIDPWYYPHRLGLYKILIHVTTPYMPFCSSSNASNVLFALPSQFGWLFQSDRLFTNGTMNISTDSWWAGVNYYLAVLPFLVAHDQNLVPNQSFRIARYGDFCTTSVECVRQVPQAMVKWQRFFSRLRTSSSCFGHEQITERLIDRCYLKNTWSAVKTTIQNALPLVQSKLASLPSKTEELFGLIWSRFLDIIAMTRKNGNLYETIKNQRQSLPFRMLHDADRAGNAPDLPATVNKSLKTLFKFPLDRLSYVEAIWKRITCNYQGRVYAQYTLENMATSRFSAFFAFIKAVVNVVFSACDPVSDV